MLANALTLQKKLRRRRRNARRSSVFGNALSNAAMAGYYEKQAKAVQPQDDRIDWGAFTPNVGMMGGANDLGTGSFLSRYPEATASLFNGDIGRSNAITTNGGSGVKTYPLPPDPVITVEPLPDETSPGWIRTTDGALHNARYYTGLGENPLDGALLGLRSWMGGVRAESRSLVENAGSPFIAGVGSGLYAINSVTDAVVGGLVDTGRLFTSSEQRGQFATGMKTLFTTNPLTTANNAWGAWSNLSAEDRLRYSAAAIASLGAAPLSRGKTLAEIGDVSPLSLAKIDEIVAMPHGSRPDPATYLSKEYMDAHLAQFDTGASRFMTRSNLEKYGIGQRDGTSFVMPHYEADRLMASANGNMRAMEEALGLPENFLESNQLVRVDIPKPQELNLRMPSGNEAGANEFWIPGGKLPNGYSEAVIDVGGIPSTRYWWNPLHF